MAKVQSGDSLNKMTARHYNDAEDVIRRDKQSRAQAQAGGVAFRRESWLGIITDEGPSEEADYTGARYWVRRVACVNSEGAATTLITVEELEPVVEDEFTGIWVTATNLCEQPFYIAEGFTSHTLHVGTLVRVMACHDAQSPSVKRYLFFGATGSENNLFVVRIWTDGGTTDGDAETQCDRTYAVTTTDASAPDGTGGVLLAEGILPWQLRPTFGNMNVPPSTGIGLLGTGFFLLNAGPGRIEFRLFYANERVGVVE